jgi:hypothetical protein
MGIQMGMLRCQVRHCMLPIVHVATSTARCSMLVLLQMKTQLGTLIDWRVRT